VAELSSNSSDPAGYLSELAEVLQKVAAEPIRQALSLLCDARDAGRRVYVMGNGGGAAIASQMVCNFAKTAQMTGQKPIRTFAVVDNVPALTAWANDTDYAEAFAHQIRSLVDPGDVVMAISSSGNSPNILAGLRAAREAGARTIGLLGFDGGRALSLVAIAIHIPQTSYGLVEDTHMAIGHALARALQQATSGAAPS